MAQSSLPPSRFAHIFFMDGVGLGEDNPEINPFVTANMPNLTTLLGDGWYLNGNGRITTERASFIPTDANLDMPGSPTKCHGASHHFNRA